MRGTKLVINPGDKFGYWIIKNEVERHKSERAFLCVCECGVEREVLLRTLTNGRSTSCGCKHLIPTESVVGARYGEWTIIAEVEKDGHNRKVLCQCSCGTEKVVHLSSLIAGTSVSCGCLKRTSEVPKVGDRFGKLVVTSEPYNVVVNGITRRMVDLICDCGEVKRVSLSHLLNGNYVSCGKCRGAEIDYSENDGVITATNPNGKTFKFDIGFLPLVQQYRWQIAKTCVRTTITTEEGKRKTLYLHRLITGASSEMDVDHHNGDPTDNRLTNLRVCTTADNCRNRVRTPKSKSGFKGVYPVRDKWSVSIRNGKKQIHCGLFANKEEAAIVYDNAAREMYGEFACLNFPRPGERSAITGKILPLIYAVDTNGVKISYDDGLDDDFAVAV